MNTQSSSSCLIEANMLRWLLYECLKQCCNIIENAVLTLGHRRSRTRLVHLEKAPLLRPLEPAAGPGLAVGDPFAPAAGPMKEGLDAKPLLVAAIRPFSCFDAPKLPMKAGAPLLLPT